MPKLNCHISKSLQHALSERSKKTGESVSHIVADALAQSFGVPIHTLFQVSTTGALVEGIYTRAVSSKFLLRHGDFGLGTFEHLDGEMVVLDGIVYQALSDGTVCKVVDDVGTPFAVVLHFTADQNHQAESVSSMSELRNFCDKFRDSENLFYAFRIDGRFERVLTRAMKSTSEGVPLAKASAEQPEFEFRDIEGTLVGIWAPQFAGTFTVPGYHFHFLSTDKSKGGHLLDCSGAKLKILVERMNDFRLSLPESEEFLRADLASDKSKDLAYAEEMHKKDHADAN